MNNKILVTLVDAHRYMFYRYIDVINQRIADSEEKKWLIGFCNAGITLQNSDKMSRWVGFVQGILFSKQLITVEEERAYSRGIYKPIYMDLGMDVSSREVIIDED